MNKDSSKQDDIVREQLIKLLQGEQAHASFDNAINGLHEKLRGVVPENLPYSIWQIVEHIRITQWDILEFSRNANHRSPKWPESYWPKEKDPKDNAQWEKTIKQIKEDQDEFVELLKDEGSDLYKPFPWGDGQNLLREAMLIADHNSYHTGEIIVIRRLLKNWK
ncbi:MAG TPA: DinB family protein [Flavipsychrobacter sp.]|nr:DinB family protein [Flavipsychrobacter sp.]